MDHTTKELEQTLSEMLTSRSVSYALRDHVVSLLLKKIYKKGEQEKNKK